MQSAVKSTALFLWRLRRAHQPRGLQIDAQMRIYPGVGVAAAVEMHSWGQV
jgi:hypothetical protein